jgi:hypothetical protein
LSILNNKSPCFSELNKSKKKITEVCTQHSNYKKQDTFVPVFVTDSFATFVSQGQKS